MNQVIPEGQKPFTVCVLDASMNNFHSSLNLFVDPMEVKFKVEGPAVL